MSTPPTLPTCDRCGAALDRDAAVAYLGERVVHGRPDECVTVFRERIAALAAENDELKRQLEEAFKYKSFYDVHFPPDTGGWDTGLVVSQSATVTTADSSWFWAGDAPICMECGRRAEVEVAGADGDGYLRRLCWECSGASPIRYLPAYYPCFVCGEPATAQMTGGDGLTRPLCAGHAGIVVNTEGSDG